MRRSRAAVLPLVLALLVCSGQGFAQADPADVSGSVGGAAAPSEAVVAPGEELAASVLVSFPAQPSVPEIPPPPTLRSDGYRSEIEAAWFSGGPDLEGRARRARNMALKLGAANVESAARALLIAGVGSEGPVHRARLAVELAPDVPAIRLALALALARSGQYSEGMREAAAGLAAIPRNLEATLWLAGSLLAMLAAVLVAGPMLFIVFVGVSVFRHAAHDLGDLVSRQMPDFARAALLSALLLVPVALGEGLLGFALAFFALGFAYANARGRRALTLAAVLLPVGLYPVAQLTGRAIGAIDSDPVAVAAYAVVRGIATPTDVELLVAVEDRDVLAQSALALWERRVGNREAAMSRYARLLAASPMDPIVLAALANMHFERAEYERSIQLSERAAGLLRSPILLFNLSQVYARSFRMDEFEGAMAQAQSLDAEAIAALSRAAAPDFVADLPFDTQPIFTRLFENSGDTAFIATTSRRVMPGWLGSRWEVMSASFALAALMALILASRFDRSSACARCGHRICAHCDGTVWNSEICNGCHHLFQRPEATDPRMRLDRLSQLREREMRLDRVALISSLLLPGVGGFWARRPGLSFLGLIFFVFGAALFVWRDGIVADPLAVGAAGPLAFLLAGAVVAFCYAMTVGMGLWIRRSL